MPCGAPPATGLVGLAVPAVGKRPPSGMSPEGRIGGSGTGVCNPGGGRGGSGGCGSVLSTGFAPRAGAVGGSGVVADAGPRGVAPPEVGTGEAGAGADGGFP